MKNKTKWTPSSFLNFDLSVIYSKQKNKYDFNYENYVGFKADGIPAIYNRMYILRDEITSGSYDWLLWLDVDAFIWDHDINLYTEVIEPNKDYAIISAAGWPLPSGYNSDTTVQWDINSGVLFFNLKTSSLSLSLTLILTSVKPFFSIKLEIL